MTHNEVTVEAVAKAIRGNRAFIAAISFGVPPEKRDECAELLARVALAAIPEPECEYQHGTDRGLWGVGYAAGREWERTHPAIPEPATVGGVTREQFLAVYADYEDHAIVTVGSVRESVLALFPTAPSTVGTVEELEALPHGTLIQPVGDDWYVYRRNVSDHPHSEFTLISSSVHETFDCGNLVRWSPQGFTVLTPATTRDVGFEDARIVILELLTIPGVRLYVQPEQMLKALVAARLRVTP